MAASGCISMAKGAVLEFASGNEQPVQEIPKAIVKNSQTKEEVRDGVLLLAWTWLIFEAVGRGQARRIFYTMSHHGGRGQGVASWEKEFLESLGGNTKNWRIPFPSHNRCETTPFL